jgi:hypothetical protein
MMRLVLMCLLLFSTAVAAQNRIPVTFELKDGSEVQGHVQPFIMGVKSFSYSDTPNGKLNRMKLDKVHRMITTDGDKTFTYEVVNVLNPKNNKIQGVYVLNIIVEGYMTLYHFKNTTFHELYIKPSPDVKGVYLAAMIEYGTSKLDKRNQAYFNRDFNKKWGIYFKDHPEISEEFAAGTIDTKQIDELVIRYNKFKEN